MVKLHMEFDLVYIYLFIYYIVYALHALAIVDCAIPFLELTQKWK